VVVSIPLMSGSLGAGTGRGAGPAYHIRNSTQSWLAPSLGAAQGVPGHD